MKEWFAHKKGQLVMYRNTGEIGIVHDVHYPEGPGSWAWIEVLWSSGKCAPPMPTRKYRLVKEES